MTILALDGFDNYGSDSDLREKWVPHNATPVPGFVTGRNGVGQAVDAANWYGAGLGIDNKQTVFMGAAFRWSNITNTCVVFEVYDLTTRQVMLAVDYVTHQLVVATQSNIILGSSVQTISFDKWYYIEFKATAKNALGAGDIEVRVNGETWFTVDSGDTALSANEQINFVKWGGYWSGSQPYQWRYVDDFYVTDTVGPAPHNTFASTHFVPMATARPVISLEVMPIRWTTIYLSTKRQDMTVTPRMSRHPQHQRLIFSRSSRCQVHR